MAPVHRHVVASSGQQRAVATAITDQFRGPVDHASNLPRSGLVQLSLIGNRDPRAVLRSCFRNWFAGTFEVAVADIGDPGTPPVVLTARLSARPRLAPIRNQADGGGGGAQLEREIGRQIKIRRRVVVEEQRMRQLKYGTWAPRSGTDGLHDLYGAFPVK